MVYTFRGCSGLTSINFGNINATSLLEVKGLFDSCGKLTTMDLSGFDFSQVKDLEALFLNCGKLESVTFGNKPTSVLENMRQTF